MQYIIIKAKDIPNYRAEFNNIATCNDIVINCAHIVCMESYELKEKEKGKGIPNGAIVLYTSNGKRIVINDDLHIETNWDLIMCYHKKSTRIEL